MSDKYQRVYSSKQETLGQRCLHCATVFDSGPTLDQRWLFFDSPAGTQFCANAGPTLGLRWVNFLCLLGHATHD